MNHPLSCLLRTTTAACSVVFVVWWYCIVAVKFSRSGDAATKEKGEGGGVNTVG